MFLLQVIIITENDVNRQIPFLSSCPLTICDVNFFKMIHYKSYNGVRTPPISCRESSTNLCV